MDQFNFFTFSECPWNLRCEVLAIVFMPFALALVFCYLIVITTRLHGRLSLDERHGVQKVHDKATPRIGGVGIFLALLIAGLFSPPSPLFMLVVASALPAFFAGLAEDLTKSVSPTQRLAATATSGWLAFYLTGHHLTTIGIPQLDIVLSVVWISVLFSAFAVAGIANAYNIIDGFNGLAGITAFTSFIAIGCVSQSVGDQELATISWIFAAATLGFIVLNWPLGRVFLGDGGAYALGFAIGWLSIMLVERNHTVSPFACLLICIYPIIEVIFSIYRRLLRKKETTSPDRLHIHSLFGRRFINRRFMNLSATNKNSMTGLVMSLISIPAAVAVQFVFDSTLLCMLLSLLFLIFYLIAYRRLVKFR
jgi:UDP-N-acetylmuramyl pentapeptide phosphotransferase/UDP-N-acetylglucosamine-1-phosphate transferase